MSEAELAEFKQRTREGWGAGNYAALAEILEPASQALVDACAISAGQEVLDVGAGNGNLALAAAREGAAVVASDLSPGMVELGRARTEAEGVDVEWIEADVEDLPFEDGRFDCAASVFGAIFAPRPERAAAEMFRVVRPGGTVGLASWIPGSLPTSMFEIRDRYLPSPPNTPSGVEWGDEAVIHERLDELASRVRLDRRKLRFEFDSPEAGWEFFDRNAPRQAAARESLGEDAYAQMREDYIALLRELSGSTDRVEIDSPYYLIVARKRG